MTNSFRQGDKMTVRETYEQTIGEQLDKLNDQIKELAGKADEATAGVKAEYRAEIRELEKQRDETEAKLHELESASDEAFEDFKSGLDQAMSNLGNAVDSATARFKNGSKT
jgi:uncharacterized coiled-coil DUF342 family protein